MKRLLFFLISIITLQSFAQTEKVNWMSMNEALEANKKNPKKIIVDMYTDWCGWCKRMDATTFSNPNIAQYINQYYYAVKLNAEGNDSIYWNGKVYKNTMYGQSRKSTHSIAYELAKGRLSYPTLVFLDDSSKLIAPIPGYRSPADIQPVLIYFAENLHTYVDLQGFMNDFNITFTDSLHEKGSEIKWVDLQTAIDNKGKADKKILLYLYSDWCTTCKVMDETTFDRKPIYDQVNSTFIPVRFNVTDSTVIKLDNYEFKRQSKEHPYHDFPVSILNGDMKMPVTLILSNDFKIITKLPSYYPEKGYAPILEYFGKDIYETQKWDAFMSEYRKRDSSN